MCLNGVKRLIVIPDGNVFGMDKLECIKVFGYAARLSSFTEAAKELNTTQSAVSKKVAWLERNVGFALFHRTPRKVSLTDAGQKYLDSTYDLLEQITLTEQSLRNELSKATGTLKITAPSAFSHKKLAEPIRLFMEQNPELKIVISVSDTLVDLYQDDIDIAVRASNLKDSSLKARKLLEHKVCYFASVEYLEKMGKPEHPSQLKQHACITYSLMSPSNLWWFGENKYEVNELISSDSPDFIVAMAMLGKGVAAMPDWMVQEQLASNKLVSLFADDNASTHALPMYAIYKNSEYIPYRIKAFVDFMANYFTTES